MDDPEIDAEPSDRLVRGGLGHLAADLEIPVAIAEHKVGLAARGRELFALASPHTNEIAWRPATVQIDTLPSLTRNSRESKLTAPSGAKRWRVIRARL